MENSLHAIFVKIWPKTMYYIVQGLWPNFGANLKICKKSNFDQNHLKLSIQHKNMYMHQKKILKWRILSLPFLSKFGPRPCTIVQGLWPNFGATLKICKKSNFDQNHLKLSIQHKNMYMHQKKFSKWRILFLPFLSKFGPRPCTIVQGLWPNFGATLKICEKSNFDQNHLKLSIQHKNMYMH